MFPVANPDNPDDQPITLAAKMDRMADQLLQQGLTRHAELLAHRASGLRDEMTRTWKGSK